MDTIVIYFISAIMLAICSAIGARIAYKTDWYPMMGADLVVFSLSLILIGIIVIETTFGGA